MIWMVTRWIMSNQWCVGHMLLLNIQTFPNLSALHQSNRNNMHDKTRVEVHSIFESRPSLQHQCVQEELHGSNVCLGVIFQVSYIKMVLSHNIFGQLDRLSLPHIYCNLDPTCIPRSKSSWEIMGKQPEGENYGLILINIITAVIFSNIATKKMAIKTWTNLEQTLKV